MERKKQEERNRMNSNNTNFLKMQMGERDYLKRNMLQNDLNEEKNLVDHAINEYDTKQSIKNEHMRKL